MGLREEFCLGRCAIEPRDGRGTGKGCGAPTNLTPGAIWRGLGMVIAVAGEHDKTLGGFGACKAIDKGRLADAGLPADEHKTTLATLCGG